MSGFVKKGRVPVTLEEINPETGKLERNTVWVREKMGFGATERVKGVIFNELYRDVSGNVQAEINMGKATVQLLKENIVDWEGPAFLDHKGRKVPVTPSNIEDLDPDWDLTVKVLDEINDRNKSRSQEEEAEELKNLPTDGSVSLMDDILVPSVSTTST